MIFPADYEVKFSGPHRVAKMKEFLASLPADAATEPTYESDVASVRLRRAIRGTYQCVRPIEAVSSICFLHPE